MKGILTVVAMFLFTTSKSQPKTDLNAVTLKEDIAAMIKDVADVHKGLMFDRADMVSYGVSGNKVFYFKDYLPTHVELLSFKGQLAGYAFKMKSYEDQQKVIAYIQANYKLVPATQKATDVHSTEYRDDNILIELDAIDKGSFEKGMTAYLNVRRPDFAAAYEKLMAQ